MRDIRPPGLEETLSAPRRGLGEDEATRPIPGTLLPRFDAPALFPPAIGLLTGKRGFGEAIWESQSKFDAVAALRGLSFGSGSPALSGLARRLLLTTAPAPEGVSPEAFALLRLRRLYALGDLDAMRRLRVRWPVLDMSPLGARLRIEVALASSAPLHACALYRAQTDARRLDKNDDAFSTRMGVFCAVLDGESQQALFTGELLRERRGDADGFLARVKAAIGAVDARAEDVDAPLGPVDFGLLRLAKRGPSDAALRSAPPALLVGLATDTNMPMATRRMASARAVARGLLSPERLRALYKTGGEARGRLTLAFAEPMPSDAYLGALIAHAPDFRALVPARASPVLARHALRAFLLLDDSAQIDSWRSVFAREVPVAITQKTADAREGALRLLIADALSSRAAPRRGSFLFDFSSQEQERARDDATKRARTRLEALRTRILGVMFRPARRVRGKAQAKSLLRTLGVLGAQELGAAKASDLEAGLTSLIGVGLPNAARAIGVETFIVAMHAIETRAEDYADDNADDTRF